MGETDVIIVLKDRASHALQQMSTNGGAARIPNALLKWRPVQSNLFGAVTAFNVCVHWDAQTDSIVWTDIGSGDTADSFLYIYTQVHESHSNEIYYTLFNTYITFTYILNVITFTPVKISAMLLLRGC